jgi:hypothetical protein
MANMPCPAWIEATVLDLRAAWLKHLTAYLYDCTKVEPPPARYQILSAETGATRQRADPSMGILVEARRADIRLGHTREVVDNELQHRIRRPFTDAVWSHRPNALPGIRRPSADGTALESARYTIRPPCCRRVIAAGFRPHVVRQEDREMPPRRLPN